MTLKDLYEFVEAREGEEWEEPEKITILEPIYEDDIIIGVAEFAEYYPCGNIELEDIHTCLISPDLEKIARDLGFRDGTYINIGGYE